MTTRYNTFEGQPSGTAWSTANSGGGNGTALDSVATAGTFTNVYDNAQRMHGTNSLHITGSATSQVQLRWTSVTGPSLSVRFYLRLVASSTAQDLISFRNSTAQQAALGIAATNQLQVKSSAATPKNFTALSLNTWYRVVLMATKGTGAGDGFLAAAYYLGDSDTPVETAYSSSAQNIGTTDLVECRFGKLTSAPSLEIFYDSITVTDAGPAELGTFSDAVNPPLTNVGQAIQRASRW